MICTNYNETGALKLPKTQLSCKGHYLALNVSAILFFSISNKRSPPTRCYYSVLLIELITALPQLFVQLILWRPLLPYGYSYKASCARPG